MNKEKQDLLGSGFKRLDIPMSVAIDKSVALDDNTDPDLMRAKFIMCHEGDNANGDYFTKDVLHSAQYTPINKPIDWEHGQPIIGTILGSVYKEDSSGRGYIEAEGVIWKFFYPELSEQIKKQSATGELRLSMECYYKDANYKIGDQLYSQAEAEDMGIVQYVGREYMGEKVYRVFKEVVFGGVGVVANPADKEAVFLSVAKDLSSHGIDTSSANEISSLSETIAKEINRVVNDFNSKKENKDTVEAVVLAKYIKAFDKAKSAIVDKFNKDSIKTKEQLMTEVSGALDTFYKEVSNISTDYYMSLAKNKSEAKELFFREIHDSILHKLYNHYRSFDEDLEAYLIDVAEDYFMYELIDYSKPYPDSIKLYKGFYSTDDGEVEIHFEKAVEAEIVYKEKADENKKEDNEQMAKANNNQEDVKVTKASEDTEKETVETAQAEDVAEQPKTEDTAQAEETVKDEVDYKSKASDLENQVKELESKLASANDTNNELKETVANLQKQLDEIEAEKVYESRLAELEGYELSDKRKASIKGMTDEQFEDFKELITELAGVKTEDTQEDAEKTEASEDVEEEIVVEKSEATNLNIEQEVNKDSNPFGHLSM